MLQAADAAQQGQAKETEAASLLLKAAAAEDAATSAASVRVCCVWLGAAVWCDLLLSQLYTGCFGGFSCLCSVSKLCILEIIDASCNHASAGCWLHVFIAVGLQNGAAGSAHAIRLLPLQEGQQVRARATGFEAKQAHRAAREASNEADR